MPDRWLPADIVVGVNGSRVARQAVLWAGLEAELRGARLVLVHDEPPDEDAVGLIGSPSSAHRMLRASADAVAQLAPDLDIQLTVGHDHSIARHLAEQSRSAQLLVLGVDRQRTHASHGALGPIEDWVAVHAHCPVVAISAPSMNPRFDGGLVVVGWTEMPAARSALAAAADEAALRRSLLRVVTVPPSRDPALTAVLGPLDAESALMESLQAVERRHPGLPIDVVHRRGTVTDALEEAAAGADLLVLGCRHSGRDWASRVGPVAGPLMRTAGCPVMLIGRLAAEMPAATTHLNGEVR